MNPVYDVNWATETATTGAISRLIDTLHRTGHTTAGSPPETWFQYRFEQLQACEIPATAFTPAMCRLFYELGFASGARRIVGIGTTSGAALNMIAAGARDNAGSVVRAVGVDIDPEANHLARRNAERMDLGAIVRVVDGDGFTYLSRLRWRDRIDLLYLDLDHPVTGKAGYARAFDLAERRLAYGSLVLAHDATVPKFRADLDRLRDRIRATGDFPLLADVPVDRAGLLVAGRVSVPTYPALFPFI